MPHPLCPRSLSQRRRQRACPQQPNLLLKPEVPDSVHHLLPIRIAPPQAPSSQTRDANPPPPPEKACPEKRHGSPPSRGHENSCTKSPVVDIHKVVHAKSIHVILVHPELCHLAQKLLRRKVAPIRRGVIPKQVLPKPISPILAHRRHEPLRRQIRQRDTSAKKTPSPRRESRGFPVHGSS